MTARKLARLFFGLVIMSCLVYFLFGVWVVHRLVIPNNQSSSMLWVIGFLRNVTGKKSAPLTSQRRTLTNVTGAVRHYRSLLDNQTLTLNCSSCALVSSSGYLLGKGAGKEIDGHSCVLRLNTAPIKDYERDVGARTSLRIMNFFMVDVDPAALPIGSRVLVWGLLRRPTYLTNASNMLKRLSNESTIHGQSREGEMEAEEVFAQETGHHPRTSRSWISTGWFAMMIALDLCHQIHVYGMVPAEYCLKPRKDDVSYHYYEHPWVKECSTYRRDEGNRNGGHRLLTEKAVFARWALRFNITFHHPSWALEKDTLTRSLGTPFVKNFEPKHWIDWLFS